MKIITLLPVKNEAWILPYSLENYSQFSDHIIIADQHSTDGSREIYKQFPKVSFFDNNGIGAGNKIRWALLDEARKIPGNNLIICLDADELISPKAIEVMKEFGNSEPIAFRADWIQLIEDGQRHRIDGVWKENIKDFAFVDNRSIVDYERKELLIDHTARIPHITRQSKIEYPILHLHYMAKARSEIKQAWYMCTELLSGISPWRINHRYAPAQFSHVIPANIKPNWVDGVDIPSKEIFADKYTERQNEVLDMMTKNGILYFEPLQIWHIPELHARFIREVGREPKPSIIPNWLIKLNEIKNKLKNF